MAIAFSQTVTANSSGATHPTVSAAFAGAVTAGSLIVVTIADDSGVSNNVGPVTDNKGNTYTRIPGASGNGTSCLNMYYAVALVGGTGFTVSVDWNVGNSTGMSFVAQEFNGFTGTPTLDQSTKGGPTTSNSPFSNVTGITIIANEVVVSGVEHSGAVSAFTLGAGYTNLGQPTGVSGHQVAQESKVIAATGAQSATFSIGASSEWICGIATFYDAPATVREISFPTQRSTKRASRIHTYPSFFRDDKPQPELIISSKWTPRYIDLPFRAKDRRYLYPNTFKDPYYSEFIYNKWQPTYPDIINRAKDRRPTYPSFTTSQFVEIITSDKWTNSYPDIVQRLKSRRAALPSVFDPQFVAESISPDKWLGSQPSILFRQKDRRTMPSTQFVQIVAAAFTDVRWLASYPDIHPKKRYRPTYLPTYIDPFDRDITYCDPLTLWSVVPLATSLWAADDLTEESLWAPNDIEGAYWSGITDVLDTWDNLTDTWDNAADTWDALVSDSNLDNPVDTLWALTDKETALWQQKCENY